MLNASACAQDIAAAYLLAAGLGQDGKPSGKAPEGDYPADFAKAYNGYATQGVVLGATNAGGNASILEGFMQGVSNSPATLDAFASALAGFWAGVAITPGIPAHGGTAVVSVVNNAATLTAAFKAAIVASQTSSKSEPLFLTLISNIEAVAKTIVWTVTEMMPSVPPAPVPFPEVVA